LYSLKKHFFAHG